MAVGQIEDRRLDAKDPGARYHVTEHVLTFGRSAALNVSQHRCLQGRSRLGEHVHAEFDEGGTRLETGCLGNGRAFVK